MGITLGAALEAGLKVKAVLRISILINVVAASVVLSAQIARSPVYTVDLSSLVPMDKKVFLVGSLAFLTDDTLAVSICSNVGCNLETIDFQGEKPRVIARSEEFENYRALFRAPDGGVILGRIRTSEHEGAVLLDSNLKFEQLISSARLLVSDISVTGETFVKQQKGNWAAFKMNQPPVLLRHGIGRVLCVSDDAVVYLNDGIVHVEGLDGKSLGTFESRLKSSEFLRIHLLGHDRLWFESGSRVEILDFDGKLLYKLRSEYGWGFREGQTADGSRLLYDRYTRHASIAQHVKEDTIAIATLGMGVANEDDNGEMVRVIDTANGKQCFEWDSKTGILPAGDYHADINPSGQLVAIVTQANLRVYRLPEDCALHSSSFFQ